MNHYIVHQGSRVALAAMKKEYIDILMPWINNPTTTAGVLITPPITYEAELAWFEGLPKRTATDVVFAILFRENETWRYVGHTGLHRITWPVGRASSGSLIGDASVHGQGCGTEAKLLLLYHAFFVLGLRKVTSEVKAFNGNSLGHLLRSGYQVIGCRKEQHFHEGGPVDEILLEVFRDEFEPIWQHYKHTTELPKLTDEQRAVINKHSGEK